MTNPFIQLEMSSHPTNGINVGDMYVSTHISRLKFGVQIATEETLHTIRFTKRIAYNTCYYVPFHAYYNIIKDSLTN